MVEESQSVEWSSSLLMSLVSAAAIAFGMGLYAIAQYVVDPSVSPWDLAVQHTWHVLGLWVLIYASVGLGLQWFLIRPIHKIYLHLYGMGAGRIRRLEMRTPIRELAEIVEGVNLMVRRLELGYEGATRAVLGDIAGTLRDIATEHAPGNPTLATQLQETAQRVDGVSAALHTSLDQSPD